MPIRVEPHAEIIPGYTLIERLGGGGFGEVWKAQAPGGLHKAIKIVHGDMDTIGEESQRANQELRAMRRVTTVRHPYILSLERFDIVEGRLIIVMELADRNLWDRFRECRNQGLPGIPREELLRYVEETAEALDLMNGEYQLQHLDIKPQNIFLVHNHIKVADFGLVKDLKDRVAATVTGGVTPVYAAPETFDGWVSRFCDQYSLAIVYQELLTGKRPFNGGNVHQLVMQHVKEPPTLTSLPPEDRPAIARALAKIPEERFGTCLELVRALRSSAAPNSALPASSSPAVPRPASDPDGSFGPSPERNRPMGTDESVSTATVPPAPASANLDQDQSKEAANALPQPTTTPTRLDANRPRTSPALPSSVRPVAAERQPRETAPVTPATKLDVKGEGELFPALVVGIGQTGQFTLKYLRQEIQERFGPPETLPSLRLFYLDADLSAQEQAADPCQGAALNRNEVLVARLNRASYYLKPRQGRPRIDTWFDTAMLYRIQRNEETGGVRALGRLAFFGNYRTIALRLRMELAACCEPEALTAAAKNTGLGVRGTCPRVYVVANLAGGTGGMFIDLAYVVREQLRQRGYPDAEVIGLFFLPTTDSNLARAMALGNTYAALTELHHFASPDVTFSARYDEQEGPLADSGPPFNRCVFLASSPEAPEAVDLAQLAAEYLCHEMTTPLGRAADAGRTTATAALSLVGGMVCQSFGLYRYTWPRRALLQRAARRCCQNLVRGWMAKENKPLQEIATALVHEKWAEHNLDAQELILRYQEACARSLGQGPESAFVAITGPLLAGEGRLLEAGAAGLQEALRQLERLVGQPAELSCSSGPAALEEVLRAETESVIRNWQPILDQFTVGLVERPGFRLAGAEYALRQTVRLIEKTLTQHETLCQELTEKTTKAYDRLQFLIASFPEMAKGGRKAAQLLGELGELLKVYPKWRYQSLVLRRVNYTFTSLRGHLSDQIREIGFFRLRLGELLQAFQRPGRVEFSSNPANGSLLFPPGCTNLEEAVNALVPEMTSQELEGFDRFIQELIGKQFRSLKYVCTASSSQLRNLEEMMLEKAQAFAAERLQGNGVAECFFSPFGDGDGALDGIIQAFDEATPSLVSSGSLGPNGLAFLSVPAGEEGRFARLAAQYLPQARVFPAQHQDDLIFYREDCQFTLGDLEIFDSPGEEAYQQMCAAPHFTPHTRLDVTEWRMPTAKQIENGA